MIIIQLIGISESGQTEELHDRLTEALQLLGWEATIEVVSDLDEMVRFNLGGIPAVVVDQEIIFDAELPSTAQIIQYFMDSGTINRLSA